MAESGGERDGATVANNRPVVLQRDMSTSHADFLRTFPKVAGITPWRLEGNVITLEEGGGRTLRIRLGEESERRIASLALPRTLVEFQFDGYSPANVETFLQRFDRSYRRGGG